MFDIQAWDSGDWIYCECVMEYFNMTFGDCLKKFGFCRQAEWNKPPLNGQKVTAFFRKYK